MRAHILIPVVLSLFISCTSRLKPSSAVETIRVKAPDEFTKAKFSDYFSSWKLIPLETNKESLIGSIDRISVYNKQFYILDRQTNSILIFDDKGKFKRRIHNIGQGPGEYIGLMDFALDKKKQELIVHSHRPYRMIYYDLNGKFLREEKLSTFYSGISCSRSDLIEINRRRELSNMAFVKNLDDGSVDKYIPFSKKEELFESYGTIFPPIVQSENTYVTLPFESTIYQYDNGSINPRYQIDFGSHNIPEAEYINGNPPKKIIQDAQRNWDGIFVSNFRECKNYLCFTYGNSVIVLYSKKDKKTYAFNVALNTLGELPFQNYFGHDGEDDNLISIYQANDFRSQMDTFKSDSSIWGRESTEMKQADSLVKENNNPILLICSLK